MEWMDEFKEMMEDESEDISEAFICCVCRDLMYKPIVLACGHISCFWCVHKSMNGVQKSSCPVCRNQYLYFPYVCHMLHLLLQKLYPKSYMRRERQTLDEETKMGCFSPEIEGPACQLLPEAANKPLDSPRYIPEVNQLVDQCSAGAGETQRIELEQDDLVSQGIGNFPNPKEDISADGESTNSNQMHKDEIASGIKLMVSCGSCKEMLILPAALNCGHVFCKCCLVPSKDGSLKCDVCQTPHPGAIPKVCLELDHFLEDHFPQEYGLRRDSLRKKQEQHPNESLSTCSSDAKKDELCFGLPLHLWNNNSKVHIGVGCDSCGMFPIIGDRYRCKDCDEQIGFDLCKDCYTSRSKLPGRFNQQHTSDHKFELVKSNAMHELMLRLLRRSHEAPDSSDASADGSDIAIYGSDITDEVEDTDLAPPPSLPRN